MFVLLFSFILQFFLLTTYHCLLHSKSFQKKIARENNTNVFLGLILLTQLITSAMLQKEVGDVMLFAGAGWHLRHQIDFYFIDANHTQYPFFPFLIFLHAGLNWLQELFPVFTFSFYLKAVLLIAMVAISFLVKRNGEKVDQDGTLLQLQFLTHPLVTLVVFFHGQVDVILLAFFVWSVWLLEKTYHMKNVFLGVGLYVASVAAKTWSIIFLPLLFLTQKSWITRFLLVLGLVMGLLGCTFVYTRLVDGSSVRTVLPAVLRPGGPVGEWGVSLLLRPWVQHIQKYNVLIFAGGLSVTYLILLWKKLQGWLAYVFIVLGVYVFIPNFGVQYLFWIVPFLYLAGQQLSSELRIFTILGGSYAFLSYAVIAAGVQVIPITLIRLVGFSLWVFCVWWFRKLVLSQIYGKMNRNVRD